jgi:uncharacterized protein
MPKRKLLKYLYFKCLLVCSLANAQSHIVARNDGLLPSGKAAVSIKWFSEKLVQEKLVFLFRKEVGTEQWISVSKTSFVVGGTISSEEKSKDSDLQMYEELIKSRKAKPITGILMMSLWVKAIKSKAFASYLGITSTDTSVQIGKTYQYALKSYYNADAPNIVISYEIKCSEKAEQIAKAEAVAFTPEKKGVGIDWRQENIKFWAVNIYKRNSRDTAFTLLGSTATMANLQEKINPEASKHIATDEQVKQGGLYFYKLAPVDFFGVEGQMSATFPVFIKDKSSPQKPLLKKDTLKNQTVRLLWNTPKDADLKGYHIYKSKGNNENFSKITKHVIDKATPFYTEKITVAGDYYYFVTSVDTAENESPSNTVIVNIEDIIPPSIPQYIKAKVDTGKVKLTWKKNNEADLWGYKIYRGLRGQHPDQFVLLTHSPIKFHEYTDVINKASTNTFVYTVTAVDSSYNQSDKSDSVSATLQDIIPPNVPYIKEAFITNDGQLKLRWMTAAEYDLESFNIYARKIKNTQPAEYIKLNDKPISASLRELLIKIPFDLPTDVEVRMSSIDIHKNESENSKTYTIHASIKSDLPLKEPVAIALKGSYNKKKKLVELKWKNDFDENHIKYMVFLKNAKGEFRPISNFLETNHFDSKISETNATNTWQLRAYLPNGSVIKSNLLEIKH